MIRDYGKPAQNAGRGRYQRLLNKKRQNFHSSMWSGYERIWDPFGSGFRRGRCIMTRTPISKPKRIRYRKLGSTQNHGEVPVSHYVQKIVKKLGNLKFHQKIKVGWVKVFGILRREVY